MPSPFPGMDPYLEARSVWPDVHASLITYIREDLQPQIRPKYIARIGERVQLASVGDSYVPDVLLVKTMQEPPPTYAESVVADIPTVVESYNEAYREPFIEIVARETGDVITLIEVLSPANKVGDGRDQYLKKQRNLLATNVSLVEIDLLGYGKETVLARNYSITKPADWRYIIDISRGSRRSEFAYYAIPLREKLPNCIIPLQPPDDDVVLELSAVFNRCYDIGSYDLLIDYSQPPPVPLTDAESTWLNTYLEVKGLKTAEKR